MIAADCRQRAGWLGRVRSWHGWVPLGVAAAVIAAGAVLMGQECEPVPEPAPEAPANLSAEYAQPAWGAKPTGAVLMRLKRLALMKPVSVDAPGFYSMTLAEEQGQSVFRVRVTALGDEIVIDAANGKVLAIRPQVFAF